MSYNLSKEYKKQSDWRKWDLYIDKLPISSSDVILDLGCSVGDISTLLAQKAKKVIGIDFNDDLLAMAKLKNSNSNIEFINKNINDLDELDLPLFDGIWTSFTAAYFPDFETTLKKCLKLLKPNAWIAIVEMSDLFNHQPIDRQIKEFFEEFYEKQLKANVYDFKIGNKLEKYLINQGLKIELNQNMQDGELTFNGSANEVIIKAWNKRFERMDSLKKFLGDDDFPIIKQSFLNTLRDENHESKTEVKFIIARKSK